MGIFTLSMIALVLSLASQGFGKNVSTDFELFSSDSLSSLPQLDVNHIQSQDGKSSSKLKLITQVNSWIVSSDSDNYDCTASFAHYLHTYSLNRKKEFFLLV